MSIQPKIHEAVETLNAIANAGFALAFHVRFTAPKFLFQTYSKQWLDHYSSNSLVMSDPTVAWGMQNIGTKRWSDLSADDPSGVLGKAAEYGLNYGTCYSVGTPESTSLGSLSRHDREFTQAETAQILDAVTQLHDSLADLDTLDPDTKNQLRAMSVRFEHSA